MPHLSIGQVKSEFQYRGDYHENGGHVGDEGNDL